MSKSIKLKNNIFIDSSNINHNRKPLNKQIPKNINQNVYVSDLNESVEYGQYCYNSETLNSPFKQNSSYDSFGIVLVIGNNFDPTNNWYWWFQIAFGTSGGVYIRRRINQNNITNWIKII